MPSLYFQSIKYFDKLSIIKKWEDRMLQHHINTIQKITNKLKKREDILAILLCGSIAHGFETKTSDVVFFIGIKYSI